MTELLRVGRVILLTDKYSLLTIEVLTSSGSSDTDPISWVDAPGINTGFIQPVSGKENFRNGRAGEQVEALMFTGIDTPGEYGYRVTQNGQSYMMLYTLQPEGISGVGHHKEITLGAVG